MKALFVLAQEDYRNEEYDVPKDVLSKSGVEVTTASPEGGLCKGQLGGEAKAELKLADVNAMDYDAVVVVGGRGSPVYLWDNSILQGIVKSAYDNGKVVAGICLSGAVLAKAGVLEGKNATVFETPDSVKALHEGGAQYMKNDVVVDGKVITANGPHAAEAFGKSIVEALEG